MSTVQISVKNFSKIRRGARAWNKLFQRHTADTPEYFTERARVFRDHGFEGVESLFWTRRSMHKWVLEKHASNVSRFGVCAAERIMLRQVNKACNNMITDIDMFQRLNHVAAQLNEVNKCAFYVIEHSTDPLVVCMPTLSVKLNACIDHINQYVTDCPPRAFSAVPCSPIEFFTQLENFSLFRAFDADHGSIKIEWMRFIFWVSAQKVKFKK